MATYLKCTYSQGYFSDERFVTYKAFNKDNEIYEQEGLVMRDLLVALTEDFALLKVELNKSLELEDRVFVFFNDQLERGQRRNYVPKSEIVTKSGL